MSIPALGGGAGGQALQRALMDAAERALADELGLLDGHEATADVAGAGVRAGSAPTGRGVRRRAASPAADGGRQLPGEALVVELGETRKPQRLEVAGGWITSPRRGPLLTAEEPVAGVPSGSQTATPKADTAAASKASAPATPAPSAPAASTGPGNATTLDRLLVVLKKRGIDFRDAYPVLREIHIGEPLPPKAELRARWAAADPAAWEADARVRSAASAPAGAAPAAAPATGLDRRADAAPPARPSDADLSATPIDDLIRARGWHRLHGEDAGRQDASGPTLQTIVRDQPANQAYVAGLTTAEFQRLVTVLGRSAPEWFWNLRGHRGLRGLAERPAMARLNATRIAGTRLAAWILAVLGMALLWYLGLHTDIWW